MPWLEDLKFPRGYQMGTHKKINDIQAFARYNVEEALLDYEQQKGIDYENLTYIEDTRHRYEVVEWLIQNEDKLLNVNK